ncbi:MAG: FMN-binding protein, partial [Lentisphaeria bacterium]|nr:FMN-binding protein [Lentisphaeria bacterium]
RELLDKDKKVIGYILTAPDKKYVRTEGFNAYINTAVVLNKEGKITGVVIGKHEETPRFMDKIRNAGFMKRWNGKTVKEAKELKVDAVSGATYSCEAIKAELKTIFGNSSIK